MGNITIWIILGALVAIVIGFLIISAIFDKKKRKKIKAEEKQMEIDSFEAVGQVAIATNLVLKYNRKALKNFVPSIGKMKMGEIHKLAHDEMKRIRQSAFFHKLVDDGIKKTMEEGFKQLLHERANNWDSKLKDVVEFFKQSEKGILEPERYAIFRTEMEERLKKLYK